MDVESAGTRLQNSVHFSPSSFINSHLFSSSRKGREESSFEGTSSGPTGERCYRESRPVSHSGFLQPLFRGSQEGLGQMEIHSGSFGLEQVCVKRVFQDGDRGEHSNAVTGDGVVDFDRSPRCLFPRANLQGSQEIPSVCLQGPSVSVSGTSNGPFVLGQGFLQGDQNNQTFCSPAGNHNPSIFGRLAHQGQEPRVSQTTHRLCGQVGPRSGFLGKHEEVGVVTHSEYGLPRLPFQHLRGSSQTYQREVAENCSNFVPVLTAQSPSGEVVAASSRFASRDREDYPGWYDSTPKGSVAHAGSLVSFLGPSQGSHPSLESSTPSFNLVDAGGEFVQGSALQIPQSQSASFLRCDPRRLGGPHRSDRDRGLLDSPRIPLSHQRAGTNGSRESSQAFSPSDPEQHDFAVHGQFNRSFLHEETRRDSVPESHESHLQDFRLSGDLQSQASLQTHPRQAECARRPAFEGRSDFGDGVVHSPEDHRGTMGSLGSSSSRSVRHLLESQTPNVRVTDSGQGSLGSGRSLNQLGEHVRLRLPTNSDFKSGAEQSPPGGLHSDPYSSSLGVASLVSAPARSDGGLAQANTSHSQASEATPVFDIPHKPRDTPSSCMAIIEECFQEEGFSEQASKRMARAQKASTRGVYEAKWAAFSRWCNQRNEDPLKASVVVVADFLVHLHEDKKCMLSTIEGYKAIIGQVLKVKNNLDLSESLPMSRLMANFKRDNNKPPNPMPGWDLAAVLEALKEGPFEPIRKADLKWVTFKTVFLLALASGKRRSELHALSFEAFSRAPDWSHVTLRPDPSFVSKTDLAGKQQKVLKPIKIEAIKFAQGHVKDKDRLLCPVRALKIYIRRTEDLRGGKKKLFVSFKLGHKGDVVKNTISFWIRKTIFAAYESSSSDLKKQFHIRAHHVRALSASWAFLRNISLDDIMDACSWKAKSTFISHYLHDLTEINNKLFKLGPVVVAQQQIQ